MSFQRVFLAGVSEAVLAGNWTVQYPPLSIRADPAGIPWDVNETSVGSH